MDLWAGRRVFITASYNEFSSSHIQPKPNGSVSMEAEMCQDFQ